MNLDISVDIKYTPKDCPSYEEYRERYTFGVSGSRFGFMSGDKDRSEVVSSIRKYIKSKEECYNCKLNLKSVDDETDLGITREEIINAEATKLTEWF